MRTRLLCGPTAALLLSAFLQPAPIAAQQDTAAPQRILQLEDYLDWERVGSPRISPSGRHVVYTRSWVDQLQDRWRSELWILDLENDERRELTAGSSPRWSPDGRRIAFLHKGEPGGTQIHVLWIDTRDTTQLTRLADGSPSNLRWSPDGRMLSFDMQVEAKPSLSIKMPARPKGADWAPSAKVITRLSYRRDRSGYRPLGHRHVFVVDAIEGGTPRQLTNGDFDHSSARWMPDGKSLVFSGKRIPDADWVLQESEVYRVSLDGEITALTDHVGPDASPAVSPDGKWIAYTRRERTADTYNVDDVWLMAADGSEPRRLASLDRRPGNLMWTDDGAHVLVSVSDHGERHVIAVEVASGETAKITPAGGQFRASDVRGDLLVGTYTTSQRPADLAAVTIGGGALRLLTDVHADVLDGVTLADVEAMTWKSTDGLEIQGWLVKPPGFDPSREYPLMLQIHGGPHGMYGLDFSFERQANAADGYLVLYTNPRGSDGYGKTFGNAIDNAYPGKDYDDLMTGVDAVIARGCVDESRMYVYGGSGGGVLTCWIVGMTDRFAAAVSMFPVTNWISFVGTTDGPYWYSNFDKLPWESIDEHWQRSPLRLVGNVTTPTMLITGELDLRTPMAQTEEYYQALKLRKVDTAMVRVPGEYHGAAGRRVTNTIRRILWVRKWFERHGAKATGGE
ncbi:MAG: S9 family peptidase [Planctomycetes bacterium]|nr:S9 family peptidase [Planctomycetota bacterium]